MVLPILLTGNLVQRKFAVTPAKVDLSSQRLYIVVVDNNNKILSMYAVNSLLEWRILPICILIDDNSTSAFGQRFLCYSAIVGLDPYNSILNALN
jgi:hypothetical protein